MKIFYGWKMVAAGGGLQFLQAAILLQAFGAYLAVLSIERGWSKTALAGAATLAPIEAALLGPVLGWIIDRFGPKGMIRAGALILGTGFILLSQIDTLLGFYGAFAVIALGASLSGYFPINVAIIQWFERKRARALSAVALGMALGGVAVPIVAWGIQTYGWRSAAFVSGVMAIAVGFPLASVFRRRPEDYGETIDGAPAPAPVPTPASAQGAPGPTASVAATTAPIATTDAVGASATAASATASSATAASATAAPPQRSTGREYTLGEALRTRAFWLLSFGHGFALLVVQAVNVHAIAHMKEGLGYTVTQASLVITLMTMAQVGGVLAGWAIGDRFDKRLTAAFCMLLHATGLLMLTYSVNPAMLIAFAVLHGSGWGLRGPLMQAIRADYFGRRAIGMILGISSLIIVFGQVGGPLLAGYLADRTGDYRLGFTVLAALSGVGSLFFLFGTRPR
jgi:MFS family permease